MCLLHINIQDLGQHAFLLLSVGFAKLRIVIKPFLYVRQCDLQGSTES